MMCGGASPAAEADDETHEICSKVRPELEGKTGRNFSEYKAISVRKQVVAGTNFFVKVHVGADEHVHVRIYRPLPGQGDPTVHSYQLDKKKEDSLEYF